MDDEKNRVKIAEDFVLDPEKTLFEQIIKFEDAIRTLQEFVGDTDLAELETLKGVDGVTPIRGQDYMTDEDLEALQTYMDARLPVAGQDFPTRDQVDKTIRKMVGNIPTPKGKKGDPGTPGIPGKNGSPDTGEEILKKLRSLKKKWVRTKDIKDFDKFVKRFTNLRDEVDALSDKVRDIIISVPGGGDNSPVLDRSATQTAHGFAVGDLLRRTPTGDVRSDATDETVADVHKIVTAVMGPNTYRWSSNAQEITQNVPAYPDGTNLYLAVGGGITNTPPDPDVNVWNNVGYIEESGTLMVLHASTYGFRNSGVVTPPQPLTKEFDDGANFEFDDNVDYEFDN